MFTRKNCHRAGVLILFMCALVIAGCGKNNDSPKPIDDPQPAPPGPTPTTPGLTMLPKTTPLMDLSKEKPAATYTAKDFLDTQKKDGNFPLNRHAGQVIELTGTINGYGMGANAGCIVLDTGPGISFDVMMCALPEKEPWKKALPSQQVSLRTQVPHALDPLGVLIWQIIEVKGVQPTTVMAQQFTREEYRDKPLIIIGVIARIQQEPNGFLRVYLKGQEDTEVECFFGDETTTVSPLSASQKKAITSDLSVKILGRCSSLGQIRECILLEPAP